MFNSGCCGAVGVGHAVHNSQHTSNQSHAKRGAHLPTAHQMALNHMVKQTCDMSKKNLEAHDHHKTLDIKKYSKKAQEKFAAADDKPEEDALKALWKAIIKDGKLTPEEWARFNALAEGAPSTLQGCGGGKGRTGNASAVSRGQGPSAPVSTQGTSGAPCSGGTSGTGPATATPVDGAAAVSDGGTTTVKLGNTVVTINDGPPEMRALVKAELEKMYQNDTEFKQGIDSKAGTGLQINIKDLGYTGQGKILGNAEQDGHIIALDPAYGNDAKGLANTIAHELAHTMGMAHGKQLEDFAAHGADAAMRASLV